MARARTAAPRTRPKPTAKPKPKRTRRQPKRILNCEPSPEREDDWRIDTAEDAGVLDAAPRVPPEADLRQSWWRIQDQGSTGSCGWAAADGVLRWHFVKTGRIATNELLSPRFQWIAAKETDAFNTRPTTFVEAEGTSLKAALDVSRKFGAVKDSVLPFESGRPYQGNAKTFYAIAAQPDQHVLQPRPRARELADVAGDEGADPDRPTSTRRGRRRRRPKGSSSCTGRRRPRADTP